MAQKRKSEWHVLIGVRVIDSIWLRRWLRDEHEWQAAHTEPSAPAPSLPLAHACALTRVHRFSHHAHTWCCWEVLVVVSLPCSSAAAPTLGWQSSVAVAEQLWTRPRELLPFSRAAQDPPSKSAAAHIAFILLLGTWG